MIGAGGKAESQGTCSGARAAATAAFGGAKLVQGQRLLRRRGARRKVLRLRLAAAIVLKLQAMITPAVTSTEALDCGPAREKMPLREYWKLRASDVWQMGYRGCAE
jgi:hypothetical protein